jgi:hypothetical protein
VGHVADMFQEFDVGSSFSLSFLFFLGWSQKDLGYPVIFGGKVLESSSRLWFRGCSHVVVDMETSISNFSSMRVESTTANKVFINIITIEEF